MRSVDTRYVVEFVFLLLERVNFGDLADSLEVVSLHQAETLIVIDKCIFTLHTFVLVSQPDVRQVCTFVPETNSLELA